VWSREEPIRHPQAGCAVRFLIRTKLYAAAAKVNIQPTLSGPRNLVWCSSAMLFIHPNTSSPRLRLFWLTA